MFFFLFAGLLWWKVVSKQCAAACCACGCAKRAAWCMWCLPEEILAREDQHVETAGQGQNIVLPNVLLEHKPST